MIARLALAIVLLILPVAARGLYFYQGWYTRPSAVPLPEYAEFVAPTPPVAVEAPALPTPAADLLRGERVLLVDVGHENSFLLSELEALNEQLAARGMRSELYTGSEDYEQPALAERLKYADAMLVVAPRSDYSLDEVRVLQQFVARGGRLLVISEPSRAYVNAANSLLQAFDMSFSEDYLYNLSENEGNFRNVFFTRFAENPLTSGLARVTLYGAHSLATTDGQLLLLSDERTFSSRTDAAGEFAPAAVSANGQVLAIGDFTFLTPPYHTVSDNAQLIANLSEFLVGAAHQSSLRDYPYLFQRPVNLLALDQLDLSGSNLVQVATLQATLQERGIQLLPAQAVQADHDLLALGLLGDGAALQPYLARFGIEVVEGGWSVPGFGELREQALGLLLFERQPQRSTLLILARSEEDLGLLLESLSYTQLSQCIIGADTGGREIALCRAGEPGFEEILVPDEEPIFEELPGATSP